MMLQSSLFFSLFSFFLFSSCHLLTETRANGSHLNATCMNEKFDKLAANVDSRFKSLYGAKDLLDARLEQVDEHHNVELMALWREADIEAGTASAFKQSMTVNGKNKVVSPRNAPMEDITDVLFLDQVRSMELEAKLTRKEGEIFLTVISNGSTTCSYLLSSKVEHGKVYSEANWAFFRFSPDGKYLAYTAESKDREMPYDKFLNRRTHGGSGLRRLRPVIVLYEVATEQFKTVDYIPSKFSVGQLHWHPDSSTLLGVAWHNKPYLETFPRAANVENFLCVLSIQQQAFRLLTKTDLHVDSPRMSPDGETLVYLENCLHSSTFKRFSPGTYEISRRLVTVSWTDVKSCAYSDVVIDSKKRIVISNSQLPNVTQPIELPDGTKFYGLYPWASKYAGLIPQRIFSEDGSTVYMSVIQMAEVLLMAVDLNTGQITMFPYPGYHLLDVWQDVILIQHSKLNIAPTIRIGRLHDDYFTTTTRSTTSTTPTTTLTSESTTAEVTTTTTTTMTTTEDPCIKDAEEEAKNSSHPIAVGKPATVNEESPHSQTSEPPPTTSTTPVTTTTQHPHATPLRLSRVYFKALTAPGLRFYKEERLLFEKPDFKENACPKSFFTAIYSYRKGFPAMPLVVLIHGGPFRSQVRSFNRERNSYLDMGMAVLEVNYRGSTGMGDESLQALVGNVGEMAVSDVHQATQYVMNYQTELLPRVALVGRSYGGFIAASMAAKYPETYKVLALQNPVLDLTASRTAMNWMFSLRGMNSTQKSLLSPEMLSYYWDRSPISKLPSIRASTLFITGKEDTLTHPNVQSVPFQRALLARNVPADLVSLPGQGHTIWNEQSLRTIAHKTQYWLHRHWGTYENECALYEMSTDGSGRPITTPEPESSTTTSALVSSGSRSNGNVALTIMISALISAMFGR